MSEKLKALQVSRPIGSSSPPVISRGGFIGAFDSGKFVALDCSRNIVVSLILTHPVRTGLQSAFLWMHARHRRHAQSPGTCQAVKTDSHPAPRAGLPSAANACARDIRFNCVQVNLRLPIVAAAA